MCGRAAMARCMGFRECALASIPTLWFCPFTLWELCGGGRIGTTQGCSHDAHGTHLKFCSYKRVKGRSHPVEKRPNMHPHKPHATSQPSRLSHT